MKKDEKRDVVLCCFGYIHSWMLLAVIYLFFLCLGNKFSWENLARACLLWGPVVVLGEIQKRGKKLWGLFLAAALWCALLWKLGDSWREKGLFLVLVVFLFVLYCYERIQWGPGTLLCPGYLYLLLYGGTYFYAVFSEQELLGQVLLLGAGLYWLLILWCRNREQMLLFQQDNRDLYRFPGESIANASRLSLVLLSVATVAGMALFPFSGLDQGIYTLGRLLRRFIAWLLSGGSREPAVTLEETKEPEMRAPLLPEQEEASPFWQAFWDILEKVFTVAILLLVVAALCWGLYWLYKKYNARAMDNGDILEVLPKNVQDKREKLEGSKRIGRGLFSTKPEDRIRRYYRKKIEQNLRPKLSLSPVELEKAAGLSQKEGIEEFHRLYEKARYSGESCSRQEAGKMKDLDRQI